jgi:hypothetical protein
MPEETLTTHTSAEAADLLEKELEEMKRKEEAELEEICRRHGVKTVYKLMVPVSDNYKEFAVAYLKYPGFEAYSLALTLENTHPLKGKKLVLQSMWLEGDERMLDIDNPDNLPLFYSACTVIDEILGIRQAMLKKKLKSTE